MKVCQLTRALPATALLAVVTATAPASALAGATAKPLDPADFKE